MSAGVTVLPNVLMIVDNSGSTLWAAYPDSYDNSITYYGLFDPSKKYRYNNVDNYFEEDPNGEWSGNFLNWACMTRWDIAIKVLTGGRYVDIGGNRFLVSNADNRYWHWTFNDNHWYDDIDDVTPYAPGTSYRYRPVPHYDNPYNDERWNYLEVYDGSNRDYYFLRIKVDPTYQPEGLLHNLRNKIRLGIMHFNHDEGGFIQRYVLKLDDGHLQNVISDLHRTLTDEPGEFSSYIDTTWTPLAETFYEAMRYFKQDSPYYDNGDYSLADPGHPERDPFYNEDYEGKVWCVKNYVIIVTDGESTQDRNLPSSLQDADGDGCDPCPCGNANACGFPSCSCSDYPFDSDGSAYLDDVTFYAHNNDLRTDLENDQFLTTHTVFIFGYPGVGETILQQAAQNGGGDYYRAEDASELQDALESIFEEITRSVAAASSVAITSEVVAQEDRIYIPYYKHPQRYLWWGNIRAFKLDAQGNLIDKDDNPISDIDGDGMYDNPVADAEINLTTARSKHFTYIPGIGKITFPTSADEDSIVRKYLDVDFNNNGIEDEFEETEALIKYIIEQNDAPEGFSFRSREYDTGHYMGDIIHSSPVFSGAPASRFDLIYGDSSYWDFYWNYWNRDKLLFVGANDGKLHAFDAETLEEKWAYIPYNLLPHLKWLTDPNYCHCFYVDLDAQVMDVKVKVGDDQVWKTLLVGGFRLGGTPIEVDSNNDGNDDIVLRSAIFALDITGNTDGERNEEDVDVLWEINDEKFGYTTSKPIVVRVKHNDINETKWYIIFGSGPKSRDGEGWATDDGYSDTNSYIFVVDPTDGTIIHTITLGLKGVNNFFGSPVAVDYDFDYSVDVIYIGDAKGNLWRIKTFTIENGIKTYHKASGWIIDVDSNTAGESNPSGTDPDPLLSLSPTAADQPILIKPAVSLDTRGRLWIYVGTGRYFCFNDNLCCDEGVTCPPGVSEGSCPAGNECSVTDEGEAESKFMAVGIYDRYLDVDTGSFKLQDSTITINDLEHRIIISGTVTGNESLTGYAIVDDDYPDEDISTDISEDKKGWYFHLLEDRERIIGDPLIYRGVAFFLSFKPSHDPTDPCTGGGTSRLYGVFYMSGTSLQLPLFDLTGEGEINEGDLITATGPSGNISAAIKEVRRGIAGGSIKAKGEKLYLPLGITVKINPPYSPPQTGIISWREVW